MQLVRGEAKREGGRAKGLEGDTVRGADGLMTEGGLRLTSGVEPQKVCVAEREGTVETAEAH